ncbi:hypothetical protein DENSPDRAFT_783637 [Dentipellis sp. KUC8613]|nr:hypothetical protein DENSPDRAFT_783637 [Dentipellis sp. KUC8613]
MSQNALPLATKALWAHLLRKPTTLERDASIPTLASNVPLTPTDRAATSTRILLHDTHARLETFTERLEKLMHNVEDEKREMTRAREDMEAERDKMTEDVVQLVNRCQTSIQKSVGEPAQASAISSLRSELTNAKDKLANVESKLDALQMVCLCFAR